MKKVLFVMKYPLIEQYSILQKLNGEMDGVEKLGYDVYYISFDKEYLYLNHGNKKDVLQKATFGKSKAYFHLIAFYDIYRAAIKAVKQEKIDIVYFRYGPLNVFGNKLFRTIDQNTKFIVEIPTFPVDRETQKSVPRRVYMKYSEWLWKKSAKYISLFSIIGEGASSYLGVPAINIDNGVAVENIPLRQPMSSTDDRIHILAVASMCKWHAYDRVIKGLAEWDAPEKSRFIVDLVGDEGDGSLQTWKKMVNELHLQDQVIFHGKMTGDPLTEMFEKATIGLCSLGMYRNSFFSGSVLKLREYMARGLPFVYAHDDPAINESMQWCMKITNDNSPVPMEKVNEFIKRVQSNPSFPPEMRRYAASNMTWETQFQKIFKELDR